MATRFSEFQRLRAAHAVARDRFCVAIHELEVDDQFSIILEYDGSFPQPWSRVEVQRNVAGLTAKPGSAPGDRPYVAISDDGDVFFIGETGIETEKIPGVGIYSAGADGSGATHGLSCVEGALYAFGMGGQIYRREQGGGWIRIILEDPQAGQRGTFSFLVSDGAGGVLAGGNIAAETWSDPEEIENEMLKAAEVGDLQRFQKLRHQAEQWADQQGIARIPTGLLLHRAGETWHKLDFGSEQILTSIFVEAPDRIWIVGTGGLILHGNPRDGFRDVSCHGDRNQDHVSITRFDGQIIVASDYSLHAVDGQVLSPIKPGLNPFINRNIPTPLKVQAVDDVLFYFDYKHGVHRWDGEIWEEIEIPPELLEREFDGLS